VLGDGKEDAPLELPRGALLGVQATARGLDPTDRVECVYQAPTEAIEVPHDDRAHLTSLDTLDRLIPQRASGVCAAPIELFEDLDKLEPFALADTRDALPL